ncbi:ATP-binding protein [Parapedobacter sp. DT-150]|uniref:ATP-binding protein n=1 Tax=Parapedobacter sp. DT-150 TaxID=3396162 RepID=UPI003F195E7B
MAKFKTSARALDLLGRQQIAGIPTAINELFKNAHDAYADNVDVDYLRKEKLLILRDNGLGMTRSDFESRWLTLGTDSKFQGGKTPMPSIDSSKALRPIMGEKGIGRLAIASIGSQLLLLTRAKNQRDSENKIVAALINWNIFELPGLDLEDIVIPIKEFDNLPSNHEVDEMKETLMNSLDELVTIGKVSLVDIEKLLATIKDFSVSPHDLNEKLLGNFTLSEGFSGTHFYISPTDESLNSDIDGEKDKSTSTKIEKMLLGFTNTMTPDHPAPNITPAFRDHSSLGGTYIDIFNKDNFFTPEDFSLADHHFSGTFDEYGQFSGRVGVYQTKEFEHKIPWSGNHFKKTECGSFKINVAYLQGKLTQSIIEREEHTRLLAKSDRHGGLYLYKDNIRILPYGNSDYDWLDIEKNRTKSASYYFFSFRRMFGVIDISKEFNNNLTEKAGREGFIENKAYRQFRDILKNFFIQLAGDFFREGSAAGPKSEIWVKKREERQAYYRALERRDKQASARKEKFHSSLNHFFDSINNNTYESNLGSLLIDIEKRFESIAQIEDPEEASQALIDHELGSRELLGDFIQKIKINQPKGFTISKDSRKDYEAYLTEFDKLQNNILKGAYDKIDTIVEDYSNRLQIEISKRKRLEQAVDFISQQAEKATRQKQREAKDALAEVTKNVSELARELMIDLENKIREIKEGFTRLEINNSLDFDLVKERQRIEDEIIKERDKASFVLESIIKQLHGIYWDKDNPEEIITSDQINDAISEELEELRERVHADIELSQLGLAVSVIHHEFNSTVNSIRNSLKDLKAWADVNEKLDGVYNNIRVNFEHLDGYLTLFTPLNRRLYRSKENIPTNEIKIFLVDLFGARLKRHNIRLIHTKGFQKRKIHGYRSTFYPVFVNIIDNAIHWLNQANVEEKIIRLHADDTGLYISNNGPEIAANDSERIFELGYTKKVQGRGMGLHISREVLSAEDYRIFLDTSREGSNVTFKIESINKP